MKLKYQLTKTSEANNLSKKELIELHDSLLSYNTRVPVSQENKTIYFHYNENNIRFILTRASHIMSGAFNLIDRQQEEIEGYKVLLNDPIIKMVKENKENLEKAEILILKLHLENQCLKEDLAKVSEDLMDYQQNEFENS